MFIFSGYQEITFRKTDGRIGAIHYRDLYKFGVMDRSWVKIEGMDNWIEENEIDPIKRTRHFAVHRHILEMVLDTVMTEEGRHEFLPRDENGKKDFSNKKICEDSIAKARSYEGDLQRLKSRMDISVTQKRATQKAMPINRH